MTETKVTKITKKDLFNQMLNDDYIRRNEAWVELIAKEIDKLNRKSTNRKKSTKNQVENKAIIESLLHNMIAGSRYTATELAKIVDIPTAKTLSSQRIVAVIRPIVESGQINKILDKRTTYFSIS